MLWSEKQGVKQTSISPLLSSAEITSVQLRILN